MTNTLAVSNHSLSWVHWRPAHIQNGDNENYLDFLQLIEEANEHLAGKIDFAFLPGGNFDRFAPKPKALPLPLSVF